MRAALWIGLASIVLVACGSDFEGFEGSGGTAAGGTTSSGGGSGAQGGTTSSGGGNGAQGGTISSGGGGHGGAVTGGGGSGGGGAGCEPACTMGLQCCDGVCVNKGNDIRNCGTCGHECDGDFPFCDNGQCGTAPCDNNLCVDIAQCCGTECCDLGTICCVVPQGPVGPPTCVEPNDHGTCDPGCPECVCASPDTPIATPSGERVIAELAVGDLVYSVDGGELRAVPIAEVHRQRAERHRVVRVTLDGGASLDISAPHPTADGRTFGELRPGDLLGGVEVSRVAVVPYGHPFTHDILPASDSGTYFAAGALVGSTLKRGAAVVAGACWAPPPVSGN